MWLQTIGDESDFGGFLTWKGAMYDSIGPSLSRLESVWSVPPVAGVNDEVNGLTRTFVVRLGLGI
jgi:hypothetical protein